jgi:phosphoribosylaminoimidazole-succinocarboxamide synthase
MNAPSTLFETTLTSLTLKARGKVRDIYNIDDGHMLIVTTDRLSAFDVILPDPIPGKGRVLTAVSNFWFQKMQPIIPNHLSGLELEDVVKNPEECALLKGRGIVVRKFRPLPVEAVVRGYLTGSGWKDYQKNGAVCGISLPSGLQMAQQLPNPVFTPSTKAELGAHDENIDFAKASELLGPALAERVRDVSLQIYREAAEYALLHGIIVADTKFEFGLDDRGELYLIDEVLTPDSSRFWPVDEYRIGMSPPSFDKQIVRDYLETLDWDKTPPGPRLPPEVLEKTAAKYREAQFRLTGRQD